jgi:hypothetical protein
MKNTVLRSARRLLWLGLLGAALSASALQSSLTEQGVPFVHGGASQEERTALHARRKGYSLWVVTTATKSGAYLADVRVVIRDAQQNTAFNRRLDGPWLFIDLPAGRYEIEATFRGETQERNTTIHAGDNHQAFFRFNTGDEVSPDRQGPSEDKIFGADKK